jgi:hypothetical protein
MAIDERYLELINADIDGEIQPAEKAALEAFLAKNAAGRALHEELQSLCSTLDAEKLLEPPTHLKHVVMNSLPKSAPVAETSGDWRSLFSIPALRYATVFATGVVMTILIVESGQIQQGAFNDVTGLVGTMSESGETAPGVASLTINKAEIAGTVTLRRADPILIIDFDVSTNGPIDIVASYEDKTVWFNGFAQLESTGTSISAESNQIRIQVDGKRRYAVFLHNSRSRNLSINLQFFANGKSVHQAVLEYEQT